LLPEQQSRIAKSLQFDGKKTQLAAEQIKRLYDLFIGVDATQVEINPFVETADGLRWSLLGFSYCVDAKLNFDDSAAFRHPDIFQMESLDNIDPREAQAKANNLNYIPLEGNIGCLGLEGEVLLVKAILVNIFGGIVNCATVAKGLIAAFNKTGLKIPMVVRLEGTNVKAAQELLQNSNLPIIAADSFEDAAKRAAACVSSS
uniref:Ligase_CoA domain-containing protein n=1 Tax=Gongylonema pulchrum TaxID=637853 RepID=A0A183ESB6_9BILA